MASDLIGDRELEDLVGEWLDLATVSRALGVTVAKVRTLVRDHQLASVTSATLREPRIPAAFVVDNEIVKGLPGLLTLLHDGGYDDREAITWIFTDAALPGRPIDALRENRGAEVKRRAQALA
jgi:hypothetical protein